MCMCVSCTFQALTRQPPEALLLKHVNLVSFELLIAISGCPHCSNSELLAVWPCNSCNRRPASHPLQRLPKADGHEKRVKSYTLYVCKMVFVIPASCGVDASTHVEGIRREQLPQCL